ncbi:Acyl-coenzyme A thioesterase PaaI [Paraburkholderia phenoliruptrix]|uniref:Acyl-coenzyme A thioesterase PaaI n=2 Tax=Paraburkholderia phenoliruptrix TaxID=252970 RepID=A0A6J5K3M4_9BURK|nr:Acyl-coenzyme A thioesterase PaaI [Paraburkholderia phenoliruptrix]
MLGLELLEARAGYARSRMVVRPEFLNGHEVCHGGIIFTLADSTFGIACNSYNINTVGASCSIEYLRPVRSDEVLIAEAIEQARAGRSGIYDVKVTNKACEIVAMFRGKSMQIQGTLIPL